MVEIGSEFSTNSVICGKNDYFEISDYPRKMVLSGRTGLHLIAEEMRPEVSGVCLPDYCCGSMIAPFLAHGYRVSFYSAFELTGQSIEAPAVLIMDYFGFLSDETKEFARRCKAEGKIVIVDATQTAFSHSQTYDVADYIVISYRKWFDSLCAAVYSKNGFRGAESGEVNRPYLDTWRRAAEQKHRYLQWNYGEKQEFLDLFSMANQMLECDYAGYHADAAEVKFLRRADSSFIRDSRRRNAKYLMDEIKKLSETFDIQLMFKDLEDEDCPLFVPILLDESKRGEIRKKLIDNHIYCPAHWPVDRKQVFSETPYHQKELSLICDQRYGLEEMKKQISTLAQILVALDS